MIRFPFAFTCIFFAIITILPAEDFTTLDGEKYEGVTLKRIEPDGLVICYSDGVKKLKFNNLPPEVCSKYGYNPESEAQFLEQLKVQEIASFNNAAQAREEQSKRRSTALEHQTKLIPRASVSTIREQLKTAEWNCDILNRTIRENEALLRTSGGFASTRINEKLAKDREELVQAQNKVAQIKLELLHAITPPPVASTNPAIAAATMPPPVASTNPAIAAATMPPPVVSPISSLTTATISSLGFFQRVKNYLNGFLFSTPACPAKTGSPEPKR
jgi:hypothetical protein